MPHACTISACEAASRRHRRPRKAFRALHARHSRCCWRLGPRQPPARACGGCCGLPGRLAAVHGQLDWHRWHAAAALQRRWGLRQRGKQGGVSHGRRGCESQAAWKQQRSQLNSTQVSKLSQFGDGIEPNEARTRRPRGGLAAAAPASNTPHAAHARRRSCRSRQAPRRPPARACDGRCERPWRGLHPPRPAGSGRGGGAATVLGPATARQTTLVSRGRHGREARASWRQQRWHQTALRARTLWLRARTSTQFRASSHLLKRPRRVVEESAVTTTAATTMLRPSAVNVYFFMTKISTSSTVGTASRHTHLVAQFEQEI